MKIIYFLLLLCVLSSCNTPKSEYKIKITFCDTRPPVFTTITEKTGFRPSNYDIKGVNRVYKGNDDYLHINVCSIEVINETKIDSK